MSPHKSPLDDPAYAAFAWARYRRLMRWMALVAASAVIVSLGTLRWMQGPIPIHMLIATILGVFFAVMLMAALMGLVFLSSGTGHDEAVDEGVGQRNGTDEPGSRGETE